jgi:hypothetical protein
MRNTPTHAPGLLSTGIPASSAISADEQDRNYSLDSNPRVGCLNTLNKTEKETKMTSIKQIKITDFEDLPNNEELWEENESGTCANVYKRNGNKVVWYTFYRYGKPSKVRTWGADKFNNWIQEINETKQGV